MTEAAEKGIDTGRGDTPSTSSGVARKPQGEPILARPPEAKPAHQRPELPDFWDHRFARGTTPWDAGGVPRQLAEFAATLGHRPRTLIPGCGTGYEAACLDAHGWPVTALDFSAAAIAAARQHLRDFGGDLLHADFFAFDCPARFQLIYERAFRCALPRQRWPDYARRCADLLEPGGLLAGYFYLGTAPKGPPFAITADALDALLSPYFDKTADQPASDSIAVFSGTERWQVWRKR